MRAKIVGLTLLIVAVVAEVFLYLPLARVLRFLMRRPGDVGSEFLGFWLFIVLPGAAAFLAVVVTRLILEGRGDRGGIGQTLKEAWLANALLWIGSAVGYNLRLPE